MIEYGGVEQGNAWLKTRGVEQGALIPKRNAGVQKTEDGRRKTTHGGSEEQAKNEENEEPAREETVPRNLKEERRKNCASCLAVLCAFFVLRLSFPSVSGSRRRFAFVAFVRGLGFFPLLQRRKPSHLSFNQPMSLLSNLNM
jgi:hypothetical protein